MKKKALRVTKKGRICKEMIMREFESYSSGFFSLQFFLLFSLFSCFYFGFRLYFVCCLLMLYHFVISSQMYLDNILV